VRAIAARIRQGLRPDAPADLLKRAETLLRNRAQYNARRARVRALAAQVRAGRKPSAPADIMASVQRHLAYRRRYNDDRVNKRRGSR
jgi:hypothetical protein